MNLYHICNGCGSLFEVDRAAEKQRYDYGRTFRCPIPISPRCRGTVKWLKEEDAQAVRKTVAAICSECNNEYQRIWLAESLTEAICTHCLHRTRIKWANRGGVVVPGWAWLLLGIITLLAFLCGNLCR
jgi:DNA-directed RNA polymerase subunit RPC12/RpoP